MIIKIFLPAGTLYQSMYHSMFTFKLQSLLPSSQSGFSWVLTGNYPRFWSWLVVASLGVQERQMFPLVFVSEILSLTFSSRGGGLGNGCFTLSWCIPRGNSEYPTVRAILKLLGSFQQRTKQGQGSWVFQATSLCQDCPALSNDQCRLGGEFKAVTSEVTALGSKLEGPRFGALSGLHSPFCGPSPIQPCFRGLTCSFFCFVNLF